MPVRFHAVTFDAKDAEKLAAFWSAVLGRDTDPTQYPGMVSIGMNDPERPFWLFMTADNPVQGRNRTHPDLATTDYDTELQRILDLGASVVDAHERSALRYITLADPEGNNFDLADE